LYNRSKTNTEDITVDVVECKQDKNTEDCIVDTVEYKEDTNTEKWLLK
jgi:hypothetical protein